MKIVLEEDKEYNEESIKRDYGDNIVSCLEELIKELEKRITLWLRVVYNVRPEEIGVGLPQVVKRDGEKRFAFYGFVGRLNCGATVVEILPKIGHKAFLRMLEDTFTIFQEIAISLPAYRFRSFLLREILASSSVVGHNLALLYSPLVLKITRRLLLTSTPVSFRRTVVMSEGEIGKPDMIKSIKLRSLGVPLGAFVRLTPTEIAAVLILVKRLNTMLIKDLERVLRNLNKILTNKESIVVKEVESSLRSHQRLIHHPLLRNRPMRIAEEVLRKVVELRRRSPLASAILKLYLSYKEKRELLKEPGEGDFQIISSHKLYELWVFASLLKYLRAQGWDILTSEEISLREGITLTLAHRDDREKKLIIKYEKSELSKFRNWEISSVKPDIVLQLDKVIYPVEVKYKYKINKKDLTQALVYMVDLSQPQLFAAFAYLGNDDVWSRPEINAVIKFCKAHPSDGINISCLLSPILKNP